MPEPPSVNLLTRYVLENPWPVAIALLLVGAIIGWMGLREGRVDRIRLAGIPLSLGGIVIVIGLLVTTSGEHARRVTREFIDHVVAGDVIEAEKRFAADARLQFGATTNIAFDLDSIRGQLIQVDDRYTITSNRITSLRIFSESSDRATVHLACMTEVQSGYAPTPSQWVLVVERQPDGVWRIARITCISVAGTVPGGQFR